jgi:hypothetical protein
MKGHAHPSPKSTMKSRTCECEGRKAAEQHRETRDLQEGSNPQTVNRQLPSLRYLQLLPLPSTLPSTSSTRGTYSGNHLPPTKTYFNTWHCTTSAFRAEGTAFLEEELYCRTGGKTGEQYGKETCYIGFCTLRCTKMDFKKKKKKKKRHLPPSVPRCA